MTQRKTGGRRTDPRFGLGKGHQPSGSGSLANIKPPTSGSGVQQPNTGSGGGAVRTIYTALGYERGKACTEYVDPDLGAIKDGSGI